MILDNTLKPGDILQFIQPDGHRIEIITHDTGIIIKAGDVGTKMNIDRISSFSVEAKAVESCT